MKATLTAVALFVLALGWISEAVIVEESGLTFSLEAVKRLQELSSAVPVQQNPRLRASAMPLCTDPMLPQEFMSLCRKSGGSASLARLAIIPLDFCEICAFAACTGC
ncbi:guanylin [Pholidichthys leucotaenia]